MLICRKKELHASLCLCLYWYIIQSLIVTCGRCVCYVKAPQHQCMCAGESPAQPTIINVYANHIKIEANGILITCSRLKYNVLLKSLFLGSPVCSESIGYKQIKRVTTFSQVLKKEERGCIKGQKVF